MILQKYMRIKYLLSTLKENGVYASKPENLNDPYEYVDIDTYGIRVCSLSSSRNAKLMWSHYADGHRGCSVQIDIPNECITPDSILRKVTYDRYAICSTITNPVERLYHKDPKWSYEKEYRAVFDDSNYDNRVWNVKEDKVFYKVKIKSVCLGCSVDESDTNLRDSLLWVKEYNASSPKSDQIIVKKYMASRDRYCFVFDKSFDYLDILS